MVNKVSKGISAITVEAVFLLHLEYTIVNLAKMIFVLVAKKS